MSTPNDTIAQLIGWERYPSGGPGSWMMYKEGSDVPWVSGNHPIPNDPAFVLEAWPDTVTLDIHRAGGINHWFAHMGAVQFPPPRTGDELGDKMALLADVLVWFSENDRKAFGEAIAKVLRATPLEKQLRKERDELS